MPPLAWCIRAARFGALIGAAFAAAGQALVLAMAPASTPPAWIDRGGAIAFEAALVGAVTFGAAVVTRGLASDGSTRRRRIAVAIATLITAPVVAAQVVGFVLRGLIGTPLTRGGVEFFLSSATHIGRALLDGYAAWTGGVALLAFAGVAVVAVGLSRAAATGPAPRRAETVALGITAAVFVGGLVVRPAAAVERVAQASPAVAFLASLAAADAADVEAAPEVETLVEVALESPPQLAGAVWKKALASSAGPRPNVVLVMLESVGTNHLGHAGYDRDVTPNLDRIAAGGRRFTRAWSTATHSNYAQMAVLSSLFPRRGATLDMYQRLDYPRYLLHDVLHDLGYVNAAISSQDETWQGMHRFQETGTPRYQFDSNDHRGPHLDTGTERIVPDELTVARAVSWIEGTRGPFGLYVNLQSTHWPYPIPKSAPRPFLPDEPQHPASYASYAHDDLPAIVNRYDNALAYVDAQVGELVDALEEKGVLDDTLLVVTSDHGELFYDHGLVTHGRSLHEAEARVPLLVHWPAQVAPGEDDRPVSTLDVLPTVIDALGLPPYPGHQGESLLAAPSDPPSAQRAVFLNMQGWRHADAVVCWPWKLVSDGDHAHLFDLAADPGELADRSEEQRAIASQLGALLEAQMLAQMRYHAAGNPARAERYAPRMLRCPHVAPAAHASR
jgi:arylsulfatase A-like enzyme